jgi:asparagine synthase (glutamine-hydrolysing)
MCGLAAIFNYTSSAPPVDQAELLRIRESMINRGPDGMGLWVSDDKRTGLAHRRLAIIDLSDSGAQPMCTPEGIVRIVFNGEIYNFRELRKELEAKGYCFRTNSDTEVLLHIYQEHGRDMVQHLRGMYTFAIWDERRRGLFLARDPFGIKPLYYSDNGSTIRVASQVKALLKSGKIDTTPEPAGYVGFYLWGQVPEPYTLYKGIRSLPAGTSLWIDAAGHQETTRFFKLTDEIAKASATHQTISSEEMHERLRAAILDSVRHHLIADVPVGIFLSAGLDSTTLVALAKDCGIRDLHTVTLGFKEFQGTHNDEVPLAELVAQHYGTTQHTRLVTKEDFQNEYQHLLSAMDQPSIDGVNSYFVSKAAADTGLKVMLSGLGGDELFGGYPSFLQIPRMVKMLSPFQSTPVVGKGLRYLSSPILKHFTSPKYAGLVEYGGTYGGAYLLRRGMYMPWELPDLMDGEMVRHGWEELKTISRMEQSTQGIDNAQLKVTALETAWYMRNQLLRDADWASMAHSLELRVPLVDVNLFQTVMGLTGAGKRATKLDMGTTPHIPLPEAVLNREKTGFCIPVHEWLLASGEERSGKSARSLRSWAKQVIMNVPVRARWGSNSLHMHGTDHDRSRPDSSLRAPQTLADLSEISVPMHVGLLAGEVNANGGIQSFMRRIIDVLVALKPSASVVSRCFSLNDQTEQLRQMPEINKLTSAWGAGRSKLRLIAHLLFTQHRIDVLIVGHIGLAPLALAMKISGRLRSYFVQLHGIEAWKKLSMFERLALLGAKGILATTQFTVQECARYNRIPVERFQVIPLCANEQTIIPNSQFKLNGPFKLLCVARQDSSERYKGFEMMFEALAMLITARPDIHLNLVGQGSDQPRLRTVANEFGIASHVTFWNSISDAELAAAYKDCDVFVMPSKEEGFGIVFLEAMRFGKPCIGGNHGGTPDVIKHGKSGYLVDYGDASALAGYIRALYEDDALRHAVGMNAKALSESRFTFSNFCEAYRTLILQTYNRE